MKTDRTLKSLLLALLAALAVPTYVPATPELQDTLDLVRSVYRTDRQAFLTETLQLTERESAAFWPLYRAYRADMDKIGDGLVKLVLEYADVYPDVSEDRARGLLKQYTALEKKLVDKRAWYLKRAGKSLPAAKVLRWAQLEGRLDLALRLQLASNIPIVPEEKRKP